MSGEHAKLSASSSARWLTCTASPGLEAQFPDTTSPYAAEGTRAHDLAEVFATHQTGLLPQEAYENEFAALFPGTPPTCEMLDAVEAYAHLVNARLDEAKTRCPDPLLCLEERVDFSHWVPDGFGTADCLIIADGVLEVIDFKYGKGVKVEAEDNPQMMLYALGAWHYYNEYYSIHSVRMTIFQPRLSDEPSTAEMPIADLLNWAEDVLKPKAQEAFDGPGEYRPGEEQCRFCRAAAQCKARGDEMLELFDEIEQGDLLSDEEIGNLLRRAQVFKSWLDSTQDYVEKTLLRGTPIPGWKMVEGRSNRKITDTAAAGQKLIAAGHPKSLVWRRELETLTNLEKLVGKKKLPELLGDLLTKPEGKPTLVLESDTRPALQTDKQLLAAFDQ
jgi:hypothetical protein